MRNSLRKKSNPPKRWYSLIAFFFVLIVIITTFSTLVRSNQWDGKRRFTLVLHQFENPARPEEKAKLIIFSLEPRQNRASYIFLPENTILNVPFGYQTYRASSIYHLGELDQNRSGGRLLTKSIENTFGVVTDGYLVGYKHALPFLTDKREEMREIKKTYFSIPGIFSFLSFASVKTNLSFLDLFRLYLAIRNLRDDQISFLNLEGENILIDTLLPDKTKVQEINKDIFDVGIGDRWEDGQVRGEHVSLRVVNATNQEGVASSFSRILDHMGANVVEKTTAKQPEKEGCTLFILQKEATRKSIVDRLKRAYHCQTKEGENDSVTADITVVLGEDYLK